MTNRQRKKMGRNSTVVEFVEKASAEVRGSIMHFEETFAEFKRVKKLAEKCFLQQRRTTKGSVSDKESRREGMVDLSLDVSAKVISYAKRVGNMELYGAVNYRKRDLVLFSDGDCEGVCRVIYERALGVVDFLGPYGVDMGRLEELGGFVEGFKKWKTAPKEAIAERKSGTEGLKAALRESDVLLKSLDELVLMVRLDEPGFYDDFRRARKIRKAGFRKLSGQGCVVDVEGNGLGFVVMSCVALGIRKRLSAKGGFRLFRLKNGIYEFLFEKEGYVGVLVRVLVIKGERSEVRVVMEEEF